MKIPLYRSIFATTLFYLLGLAATTESGSVALASLATDRIASPLTRIVDSLRLLTAHLENRIAELSTVDSVMVRRLALPVVSSSLRMHLETMSYVQPALFSPSSANDPFRLASRIDQQQRFVDLILSSIDSRRMVVDNLPTLTPAQGIYTSSFGYRVHPISGRTKMHEGIDLSAPSGTPIRAPGNGVVSFSGRRNGYGNTVQINHAFGYATLYGHCSRLLVKEGDTVQRGQIIALVGSTGASTGPHLHYEVSVEGTKVAPDGFLITPPIAPPQADQPVVAKTRKVGKAGAHGSAKKSARRAGRRTARR